MILKYLGSQHSQSTQEKLRNIREESTVQEPKDMGSIQLLTSQPFREKWFTIWGLGFFIHNVRRGRDYYFEVFLQLFSSLQELHFLLMAMWLLPWALLVLVTLQVYIRITSVPSRISAAGASWLPAFPAPHLHHGGYLPCACPHNSD